GRSVAPVPYLGSAVVATAALLDVGDTTLLKDLAGGTLTAALAVPFAAGPPADWPTSPWMTGPRAASRPARRRRTPCRRRWPLAPRCSPPSSSARPSAAST